MSVARGALAVGRLVVNLGYTAVALKLDRDAAIRSFRRSLRQAGVPDESIDELEGFYPELNISELTQGLMGESKGQSPKPKLGFDIEG